MKNKLLSLASLLAVFNANAIEIGPTGSGVELVWFYSTVYQGDETSPVSKLHCQVELTLDYSTGPVSALLIMILVVITDGDDADETIW